MYELIGECMMLRCRTHIMMFTPLHLPPFYNILCHSTPRGKTRKNVLSKIFVVKMWSQILRKGNSKFLLINIIDTIYLDKKLFAFFIHCSYCYYIG